MPNLPLAGGEQGRKAGSLTRLKMRNIYVEPDPSNAVDGLARLQRPGLAPFVTLGTGPINAVFQQDGTFGGDHIVVSGTEVFRVTDAGAVTKIGDVADERAQIVASGSRALIISGSFAYSYNGSVFRIVIMPDGQPVASAAFLNGFFLLLVLGNQRVYYMEPGEDDPDALAFFEAETFPDRGVGLTVLGDELWILGTASEEVWALTGDLDAPFQPAGSRTYQNGCRNRDTVVNMGGAIMYVARDGDVVFAQGIPERIADPDVVESVRAANPASLRAWRFRLDTHHFYVLTSNLATWVFDITRPSWVRWSSWQREFWRAHLGTRLIAGDSEGGALWRLVPGRSNDAGLPMERLVTAGVEVVGAPVRCNSVSLRVAVGNAVELGTGIAGLGPLPSLGVWNDDAYWFDGTIWIDESALPQEVPPQFVDQPRLEMRWSDDEGNLWTDWRPVSMGRQGQYRAPVVWRKLGLIRRPGRLFEFRATDNVEFRISHAQINEAVN
jgi:hypothetical protein